jgi:hypothetical protein
MPSVMGGSERPNIRLPLEDNERAVTVEAAVVLLVVVALFVLVCW